MIINHVNNFFVALLWMVFQRAIIAVVFTSSPVFVAAAAFSAFTLIGKELTAEVAFTAVGMLSFYY